MKPITELKSWADLADNYDLILFNKMIELNDGEVYNEYIENMDLSEYTDEELQDGVQYNIEVFQWYLIGIDEYDVKYLNDNFNLDIFYSDTLDNYVLPVTHYGTAWDMLALKGGYIDEK